tara:strand:+ start:156 stop:1301 length:1146 start_codon:yes stop_codon:yes gene_type:complete
MFNNLLKKDIEKYLAFFLVGIFISFIIFNNLNNDRKNFLARSFTSNYVHLDLTDEDIRNAQTVLNTGIYIDRIYDLNPENKTFKATGWLWVKWKGDKEIPSFNEESAKSPITTLDIINAIEWDSYYVGEPIYYFTKDEYHYESKGFSGRFIYDDVDYRKFPFELLSLPIELTAVDHWIDELILTNKEEFKNSSFDPKLELQGYKLLGLEIKDKKRVFNTSFGLNSEAKSSFGDEFKSVYPSIIASINFKRAMSSSIWNLFIPLITVLLVVICSPLIDPRNSEPKIALPASVLLVLVFLQQSYKSLLPSSLTYLTFLDYLYGWSYLITLLVFLESLYTTNKVLNSSQKNLTSIIEISRIRGKKILFFTLIFTPLYAALCWII